MSLNRVLKTFTITAILLVSLFTTCLTYSTNVKAEDIDGEYLLSGVDALEELLIEGYREIYGEDLAPNPFKYVGVWDYSGNETNIDGDMVFDLYFSSTLLTRLGIKQFKETITLKVLHQNSTGIIEELNNASKEIELNPEILDGKIQKFSIKLEDVDHNFNKSDTLFFVIDIDQSEKLINSYVEKQYDRKIKPIINKIANLLNNSKDETLAEAGFTINEVMDLIDDIGVSGDDMGDLFNIFTSSAFYFGSSDHSSKIEFTTADNETHELYFQNSLSEYNEGDPFLGFKVVNETKPVGDDYHSYPPIANPSVFLSEEGEEWTMWLVLWAAYNIDGSPDYEDENKVVYYLHEGESMDSVKPESSDSVIRSRLSKSNSTLKWDGPKISMNKIINNITIDLYLHYPKILSLIKPSIKVTVYDGDEKVATSEPLTLDRTKLNELLKRGPDEPITFYLDVTEENYEIFYDHNLRLEVTLENRLFSLRDVKVLYNSENYPSSVTFYYNETENINIYEVEDEKVYAGGSTEFLLTVNSKYDDTVNINVEKEAGEFTVYYYPKKVDIKAGESAQIHVLVNSTATDDSAYGDETKLLFNATGKTGLDSEKAYVEVSKDEVIFDFDIVAEDDCFKIEHGHNKTYSFTIRNKNSGFLTDDYSITVISENDLNVSYDQFVKDLSVYDKDAKGPEGNFNVKITVPWYTDVKSDKLTLLVSSAESNYEYIVTLNLTIKIQGADIFESIYHIFESASEAIGLDEIMGDFGPWFLIFIIVFLIMLFVIIIILLLARKFVKLSCLYDTKEISPDEVANYELTVSNPCKRNMSYDVSVKANDEIMNRWGISLDINQVNLEPGHSQKVVLTVDPSDFVKRDDFAEVKVVVKPVDKNKIVEIKTLTKIKDQKVNLKITGVVHWPRHFNEGEKVETSFKLSNRGNVSADNITVILYVNGEEKNRAENITIPRGGFADIEIPWIAGKGKNEVNIVVK